MSRLDRITIDPSICHGQPTIRGMRYPVVNLLELLAGGMTLDEVLEDYPSLQHEDLLAALEYGALAVGHGATVPLGAARGSSSTRSCRSAWRPLSSRTGTTPRT